MKVLDDLQRLYDVENNRKLQKAYENNASDETIHDYKCDVLRLPRGSQIHNNRNKEFCVGCHNHVPTNLGELKCASCFDALPIRIVGDYFIDEKDMHYYAIWEFERHKKYKTLMLENPSNVEELKCKFLRCSTNSAMIRMRSDLFCRKCCTYTPYSTELCDECPRTLILPIDPFYSQLIECPTDYLVYHGVMLDYYVRYITNGISSKCLYVMSQFDLRFYDRFIEFVERKRKIVDEYFDCDNKRKRIELLNQFYAVKKLYTTTNPLWHDRNLSVLRKITALDFCRRCRVYVPWQREENEYYYAHHECVRDIVLNFDLNCKQCAETTEACFKRCWMFIGPEERYDIIVTKNKKLTKEYRFNLLNRVKV